MNIPYMDPMGFCHQLMDCKGSDEDGFCHPVINQTFKTSLPLVFEFCF